MNGDDAPPYGRLEYWNKRYADQFNQGTTSSSSDAYHAWYFTYQDLRPLILPIVLGGVHNEIDGLSENRDDEKPASAAAKDASTDSPPVGDNIASDVKQKSKDGADSKEEKNTAKHTKDNSDGFDDNGSDEADSFVEVQESDSDSEDDEPLVRSGLAKDGPISVLEIGCGDVPLGVDLTLDLPDLAKKTGRAATNIICDMLCIDYSEIVINAMKQKYQKQRGEKAVKPNEYIPTDLPLKFEVADARSLPYEDSAFDLILEKGTLDAMLSDKKNGAENCKMIITECARVLSIDGYIMIISHLNAQTEKGRDWLQKVIYEGLRDGDSYAAWDIEVHGSDENVKDDNSDDDADTGYDKEAEKDDALSSAGPAVYIIQKQPLVTASGEAVKETTRVRFFGY